MKKILLVLIVAVGLLVCSCYNDAGSPITIEAVYIDKYEYHDFNFYIIGRTSLHILTDEKQPAWVLGHVYSVTYRGILRDGFIFNEIISWEEIK